MLNGRLVYPPIPGASTDTLYINAGDFFQTLARDLVRACNKVRDISPALTDLIREKVLFRFTIAGSGGRGES